MLSLADPDEARAVVGMFDLAVRTLTAPSQADLLLGSPQCGHGAADLLLDGTLIEVKSGRGTRANTVLTGDVI
ncbi:hypothetical protein [Brachybacterium endophyticum]|nr:hypothetical protein [Brachybacterium endophyticum]